MQDHFHTGIVAFVFNGLSAILFIQLVRLLAAHLTANGHDGAGAKIGGIVTFS